MNSAPVVPKCIFPAYQPPGVAGWEGGEVVVSTVFLPEPLSAEEPPVRADKERDSYLSINPRAAPRVYTRWTQPGEAAAVDPSGRQMGLIKLSLLSATDTSVRGQA